MLVLPPFLKNTGTKTLWGNGLPLSNPHCINPTKYKNQGILGTMLEQVREVLFARSNNYNKENTDPCSDAQDTPHVEPKVEIHIISGNTCLDLDGQLHVETTHAVNHDKHYYEAKPASKELSALNRESLSHLSMIKITNNSKVRKLHSYPCCHI